jgi:hypothetical protein
LESVEAEPVEVFASQVTDHTDPEQFRELRGSPYIRTG